MLVRMTRTLYAQLVNQRFFAPKPFHMPPQSSPDYKAYDVGMKLVCEILHGSRCGRSLKHMYLQACGFEMLYSNKYLRARASDNQNRTVDVSWLMTVTVISTANDFV